MNDPTDIINAADINAEAEAHARPEDIHPEIPLGDLTRDLMPAEVEAILAAYPRTIIPVSYTRMVNFNAANTYEQLAEAYANITADPLRPPLLTFTQAAETFIREVHLPLASVLTHDLHAPLAERARLRAALANDVSIHLASPDPAVADAARRAELIIRNCHTDSRAIGIQTRAIRKITADLGAAAFAPHLARLPIAKATADALRAANEEADRIFARRLIEVSARTTGLTRARRAAADAAAAALASDINAYLRFNTFPGSEAVVRAANIAILEAIHTMRRRAAHHHRHPAEGGETISE